MQIRNPLSNLIERRAHLTSIVFLVIIIAPMATHFLFGEKDKVSQNERRALASAPALSQALTDWPGYTKALNAWMNDRFGFRRDLILLHHKLRRELDLEEKRNALRGINGWLFTTVNKAMAMHQGLAPFGPGEAEAWLDGAVKIKKAAEEKGAKFFILIPPNKISVYPENLPGHPIRVAGMSRINELQAHASSKGVTIINPLTKLLEHKQNAALYYKTDTHWTAYGAFVGYQNLMQSITAAGINTPVVSQAQLKEIPNSQHTGDIFGLLGEENPIPETISRYRLNAPSPTTSVTEHSEFDFNAFKAKTWTTKLETSEGTDTRPNLLVIGDSFFNALAPYLRESFSTVTYVHHRTGRPPLSALDLNDYDVVVLESVERMLSYPMEPQETLEDEQ